MDKLENQQLYEKYIVAIQDINRSDELEKNISNYDVKNKLKKLRNDRVNECHYLNEEDDKRTNLRDKIINMPVAVKNIFNKKYPKLIDNILPYIAKIITIPSKENNDEIGDWWE
jgi:hypothetical protein